MHFSALSEELLNDNSFSRVSLANSQTPFSVMFGEYWLYELYKLSMVKLIPLWLEAMECKNSSPT
jgi:hypothetical protein